MSKNHPPTHQLEIRVARLSELFNSMDPTPFIERDLDSDAEEYIETWALEYPQGSRFRIIVHLGEIPAEDPTSTVAAGIHNFFNYKAVLAQRQVRRLLLEGRTALLIGLSFMATCILLADLIAGNESHALFRVLKESLIIGGWVAMWRPMQIFLYEWWPLVRRIRIYRRLGHALIHITTAVPAGH